jgi:hypothetical protein
MDILEMYDRAEVEFRFSTRVNLHPVVAVLT